MPAAVTDALQSGRICVVTGTAHEAMEEALAGQTLMPQHAVVDPPSLRAGVERARASGPDWVWVLDGAAIPRPEALAALVGAQARAGAPAALLAGIVRDRDGRIEESRSFWFRSADLEPAMAVAANRMLPIRATSGPVLVRADAVATCPPASGKPLSAAAIFEWTTALLRSDAGFLVPESEYDAREPVSDPLADPGMAARLVLGPGLRTLDRVQAGVELVERAGWRRGRPPAPAG